MYYGFFFRLLCWVCFCCYPFPPAAMARNVLRVDESGCFILGELMSGLKLNITAATHQFSVHHVCMVANWLA